MANAEQLARLKASVAENNRCAAWNQWRRKKFTVQIDLRGADFNSARLFYVDLSSAHLNGADFRNSDLTNANFSDADVSGAQFRGANLSDAQLPGADFRNTDLTNANLSDANLRDVHFNGSHLNNAQFRGANLSGAQLLDAYLSNARLIGASLCDADFTNADLTNADLRGAHLSDANLSRANLSGANFTSADLSSAKLSGADLRRTNLTSADLNNADLTNAIVFETHFPKIDLRYVIGLTTIYHQGPSHVATDTIYESHGEIPDEFLRGCGLPDEMIGFVHSIAGAIQYYSAFISYNHEDEAFATRLYNDLQANNVRCWKYTEDVKIGDVIERTVDQAIRLHDKLLVIFSAQSVHSDWVADEVERAMKREDQEQKTILFPVTIDDAINQVNFGWAKHVRRDRNIGDFTAWKDQDQYQPLFGRLLRDLKADER